MRIQSVRSKSRCVDDVDDAKALKEPVTLDDSPCIDGKNSVTFAENSAMFVPIAGKERQVDKSTRISLLSPVSHSGRRESALGLIDNEQCCKTDTIDGAPDDVRRA